VRVRYCDLFSGIGGFSLAMQVACAALNCESECVTAVDIDASAVTTFNRNFSHKAQCENICKIQNLPKHDIMFGGFPCQPFSRNNSSYPTGMVRQDDTRANLFLELVRLLNAAQPSYFVFENVSGLKKLKNDNGPVFNQILSRFESAGYAVYHKILNASNFGVPQQRRRLIFVGIRRDIQRPFIFPNPPKKITSLRDILENEVPEKYLLQNLWKNRTVLVNPKANITKVNHPFEVGTSRYQVMEWLYNQNPNRTPHLTAPNGKLEATILYGDTPSGISRQADRVYDPMGIAPTIATFGIPSVASAQGLRQLTPRECARLQGFPDSFILPENDSHAYKQIGNAVCIPVISAVIKNLLEGTMSRRTDEQIAQDRNITVEQLRDERKKKKTSVKSTDRTSKLPSFSSFTPTEQQKVLAICKAVIEQNGCLKSELIEALNA
jgi:DNA (cytosine-5)-methyltransferase 1